MNKHHLSRKLLAVILPCLLFAGLVTGFTLTQPTTAIHAAGCETPSVYLADTHDGYATVAISFNGTQATIAGSGSWNNTSSGYSGTWSDRYGNTWVLFVSTQPGYGNVTWNGTVNYSAGIHSSQMCSAPVHLNAHVS